MILRIIYTIWKFFWRTVFAVVGIALLLLIVLMILLQLPPSKQFILDEVLTTFNEQFEGRLEVDQIGGILPFNASVNGGRIYAPADSANPVITFAKAEVQVSWWELLQQNLVISSFNVTSPTLLLHYADDEIGLLSAFRQKKERPQPSLLDDSGPRLLQRVNIYAPQVGVQDGRIRIDESIQLPDNLELPTPLVVDNLSFTVFLELTESQVYFDLPDFVAEIPESPYEFMQVSGQFYNDDQYFELNRFRVTTEIGHADFSFEATPVNIFDANIDEQFKNAFYRLQITESSFQPQLIRQFTEVYPGFDDELEIELISEGTLAEYHLDKFQANIGQSSILITGKAENLLEPDVSYISHLENVVIHPAMLDWISRTYFDNEINLERYQLSTIRGELEGDKNQLNADFFAETQAGSFLLNGTLGFADLLEYDLQFEVDSLDITPFLADTVNSSIIQGVVTFDGAGIAEQAQFTSRVDLSNSIITGYQADSFIADFNYGGSRLHYDIRGASDRLFVNARGLYGQSNGQMEFVTEGEVQNFDLTRFYDGFHADSTNFNSTFSANVEWNNIDDLTGRISFEMDQSTINADTLRPHQFYSDISSLNDDIRRLRFTSSFFDGEISGTLRQELLVNFANHWTAYLRERIAEEFFFDEDYFAEGAPAPVAGGFLESNETTELEVEMTVKDLSLLRKYFPNLPDLHSSARLNTSINGNADRLLITGSLADRQFQYGDFSANNFNAAFTGSFRHDSQLKTSSTADLQLSSDESIINGYELKTSYMNLSMRDDSLNIRQRFERLHDDLRIESTLVGYLETDRISVVIDDMSLGTSAYNWYADGRALVSYSSEHALEIHDLVFISDTDYIEINGRYSTNFEDSVEYTVQNLDLSRVSDLIDGRIRFSGILNGDFTTQTLTQIPSIEGNITVRNGRIQNRVIGDVTLNSVFNSELNRFDTDIHIYTDPLRYPGYYLRNDETGQDLRFSGYFKIPDETTAPDEELFHFDADLREVDMWIVTFIVPNVVEEMEGSSSGTGYINGSRNGFDFSATFNIEDVYGKPIFTNVGYTMNGELDFNRSDGLLFRDIELRDSRNGTGLLYGQVDLDDFSPLTILDLTLNLNNLHFMNNSYDPDIPFYGSIYGTGQVQIIGTNFAPVLRTTRPLVVSSNSSVSIPLEPEIELEQDRRFIQFVESFDTPFWERHLTHSERAAEENGAAPDLTFLELFTMDLQVQANTPLNVRLIFDPVTNDILNANGTGQVRILLEDQDVRMFGRFNIVGGDYQFVSGDVFTRRFTLQEGGSISWSGDLVNAGLDVTAVYRARPNVSTLMTGSQGGIGIDPNQRIPIELVLHIGGTITSVENDFFFRVPYGIESTVDPTIASQISNLNQNEDEKLIQATSILLSGNFIPSSDAQGLGLAEGFSGTAAVVNPLITSQVINPLLSNQINSLLRSDITFDIDFNLTAFNEVDLGVALRLFDDRVILRREGQITGEQSDIGDLGATYRINRTFSVTAFHRQDPTLSYTSSVESRQAQEMNGVGLEAQVQFNTWQNLRARISSAFRSLLGIKQNEEQKSEDESLAKKE